MATAIVAVIICILIPIAAIWGRSGTAKPLTFGRALRLLGLWVFCLISLGVVGIAAYGCWLGILMFIALTPTAVIGGFILFSVSAVLGLILASLIAGIGFRIYDGESD